MERRGVIEFIGGVGTGTLLGYYLGAKEALGIQDSAPEPERRETTAPSGPEPETTTAPSTEESPSTTTAPEVSFADRFTTPGTGYDPEKWSLVQKTRFDGDDIAGDRVTQTGADQLRIAPQSYESVYLRSEPTFSPPVTLTLEIASATHSYGTAADLGFAMPGETYPGRGGERSGRGRMFKWTTDSVHAIYNQDGDLGVMAQADSPLHDAGDSGENQSGNGAWTGDVDDTEVVLEWTAEAVSLTVGGQRFAVTENVPTDPMPLFLTGIEWVGSEGVTVVLDSVAVTRP